MGRDDWNHTSDWAECQFFFGLYGPVANLKSGLYRLLQYEFHTAPDFAGISVEHASFRDSLARRHHGFKADGDGRRFES